MQVLVLDLVQVLALVLVQVLDKKVHSPGPGLGTHPDELLQPSVPCKNFLVELHSFRVSTAELGVKLLHVFCRLS